MEKKKKKGLNLIDFFMLGFGSIVGVGWAVASNGWMASGGGVIPAVLGYLFFTIALIPVGFCYAELTCAMPVCGGEAAFSYKAFGTFPSFLCGWALALAYVIIVPWEAIYINNILALIFPALTAGEPLYTLAGVGIYAPGLIVGIILSLFVITINWRGIRIAGKVQTTMGSFLAIVGLLVIVFAFAKFNPENLQPLYENVGKGTHTSMFTGVIAMMIVAPFFLGGFDTIPQGAEEGEAGINFKNLGRVIVLALLSVGIFYSLILFSTGGAIPWQEYTAYPRPAISLLFTTLYGNGFFGASMYWLAYFAALAGLFTTWNGFYIASARLLVGMGRGRMIPEFFASRHPKYGTPKGANLFVAIACLAGPFVGLGVIDPMTSAGGVGFVVGWFITSISCIRLRYNAPDMPRPYRVPGGQPLMWIAAVVAGVVIVISFIPGLPSFMGPLATTICVVWMALGLAFYAGSSGYRKAITEEERVKAIFEPIRKGELAETTE